MRSDQVHEVKELEAEMLRTSGTFQQRSKRNKKTKDQRENLHGKINVFERGMFEIKSPDYLI